GAIDVVEKFEKAGQDVQARFQLAQLVLQTAGDDLQSKVEKVAAKLLQRETSRLTDAGCCGRRECGQVDVEIDLQVGVLEEVGHHGFAGGIALDLDDDADDIGRLIAHVNRLR